MIDEEERGARRKEGRGGRSDEESESCKEKMKKEKVARGRIVDLGGLVSISPCLITF